MIERYIKENIYEDDSNKIFLQEGKAVEIVQATPNNNYASGVMVTIKVKGQLYEIDSSFLSQD